MGIDCFRDNEVSGMINEANKKTADTLHQCWVCGAAVTMADNFCSHCGMRLNYEASGATGKTQQQPTLPSVAVHTRLAFIEKYLLATVIGVGAVLLLIGWIALQLHQFGPAHTNTRSENSKTTQQAAVIIAGSGVELAWISQHR
jgi:hypothetical protein